MADQIRLAQYPCRIPSHSFFLCHGANSERITPYRRTADIDCVVWIRPPFVPHTRAVDACTTLRMPFGHRGGFGVRQSGKVAHKPLGCAHPFRAG